MPSANALKAPQAPDSRGAYIARINRVLDHIGAHLAEPLDLQTLAEVAHFSPVDFPRSPVVQHGQAEGGSEAVRMSFAFESPIM